ncbi:MULTISPECIES: hypothetical protein [unclassified Streptomyces]|uniref:hypothetical protein n=1 Tax=unclassified Streptomyces TaxID=2593676 RepID=UPI0032D572CE
MTATRTCSVCATAYGLPDVADRPVPSGPVCSLCCGLDAGCGDVRKDAGGGGGTVLVPLPAIRTG